MWEPQSYQPMFRAVLNMTGYYEPFASLDVYHKAFAKVILADHIYVTTYEKDTPALPHTILVMQASSGEITNASVSWQAIDPVLYRYPGRFTISGESEYGAVTAVVRVMAKTSRVFRPSLNEPR